jgi:hypothetical protein
MAARVIPNTQNICHYMLRSELNIKEAKENKLGSRWKDRLVLSRPLDDQRFTAVEVARSAGSVLIAAGEGEEMARGAAVEPAA